MRIKYFKGMLCPLAVAICATSNVSYAATGDLEEIIVTATQREQSLQDVPISMSVINSDTALQNSIISLSEIATITPGLSIAGGEVAIRGVATSVLGIGVQSSTAIYLDGVYLNGGQGVLGDLLDIERVEILRGPQGTLFGRNAAAGAISVTTAAPSSETFGAVNISAGNYGLYDISGLYNVALSENLLFRGSVSKRERDGTFKNLTKASGHDDFLSDDTTNARVKLSWLVNDDLTVNVLSDYTKYKGSGGGGYIDSFAGPAVASETVFDTNDTSFTNNAVIIQNGQAVPLDPGFGDASNGGLAIKLDWAISENANINTITSYRVADTIGYAPTPGQVTAFLPDGSTAAVSSYVDLAKTDTEEFNQEIRFSYATERADWFVGLNYNKTTIEARNREATPAYSDFVSQLGSGSTPPIDIRGDFDDAGQSVDAEIESIAVFGDIIYSLTDTVNISVGARYSTDRTEVEFLPVEQRGPFFYADLLTTGIGKVSVSDRWSDLSGRLVLDWSLSDDVTLFAGVTQGYKSGGFNTVLAPFQDADDPFDEENSTNYEAGFKTILAAGSLQLNGSIYYTDYENFQTQVANPFNPSQPLNLTVDAVTQGVDLEAIWQLSENFTLTFATTYQDAEYTEDLVIQGRNGAQTSIDKGQELIRAPEFSHVVSANYVMGLDSGSLRFNVTASYTDDQRLGNATVESQNRTARSNSLDFTFTEDDFRSDDFTLVNARITYASIDEKWSVALWGRNIFDESYRTDEAIGLSNSTISFIGGVVRPYFRNEPSTYGVDFNYNF